MKRFLFRCDVSPETGKGHLSRCLTLAKKLKEKKGKIVFACRSRDYDWSADVSGLADKQICLDWDTSPEADAKEVIDIARDQKIDVCIVDHYRTDEDYQKELHGAGIRWMQFDGIPQKPLWADWVFNASPVIEEKDYLPFKKREETRFLLGPQYALLRDEFCEWRVKRELNAGVKRILLSFGGGDDRGCTLFCLNAIHQMKAPVEWVVLSGSANPRLEDIKRLIATKSANRIALLVDEKQIAKQMVSADLAIISGGVTTFEAACLGLPSLIIQIAANQAPNLAAWEKKQTAVNLGLLEKLTVQRFLKEVKALMNDAQLRKTMSLRGKELVDGLGAGRVADALFAN